MNAPGRAKNARRGLCLYKIPRRFSGANKTSRRDETKNGTGRGLKCHKRNGRADNAAPQAETAEAPTSRFCSKPRPKFHKPFRLKHINSRKRLPAQTPAPEVSPASGKSRSHSPHVARGKPRLIAPEKRKRNAGRQVRGRSRNAEKTALPHFAREAQCGTEVRNSACIQTRIRPWNPGTRRVLRGGRRRRLGGYWGTSVWCYCIPRPLG